MNKTSTDKAVAQRCEELLDQLPPFPPVALQLMRQLNDDDADIRRLVDLLGSDQALTAQLMRQANSALFRMQSPADSIRQCVVRLGFQETRRITVRAATASYASKVLKTAELRRCWRHSLACAELCGEIAAAVNIDAEAAYTAGLLHDIGRLALLVGRTDEYSALIREVEQAGPVHDSLTLLTLENRHFGVDHCEVGCWLMESWNAPLELGAAAGRHHEPPATIVYGVPAVVHFGCQLASALGFTTVDLADGGFSGLIDSLPQFLADGIAADEDALRERIAAHVNALDRES